MSLKEILSFSFVQNLFRIHALSYPQINGAKQVPSKIIVKSKQREFKRICGNGRISTAR